MHSEIDFSVGPLSVSGLVFSVNFTTKYGGKANRDSCFLKTKYAH